MSGAVKNAAFGAVRRVICDARARHAAQLSGGPAGPDFKPGDVVHALRPVKNDGVYPHRDIGEVLVQFGDAGVVRERWSFLGESYFTVEFAARAVVVIMRGREMMRSEAP